MHTQVQVHDAHVSDTNAADKPAQNNCYTLRCGACRRAQTCLFVVSLEKRWARAAGEARARRDGISVAAARLMQEMGVDVSGGVGESGGEGRGGMGAWDFVGGGGSWGRGGMKRLHYR